MPRSVPGLLVRILRCVVFCGGVICSGVWRLGVLDFGVLRSGMLCSRVLCLGVQCGRVLFSRMRRGGVLIVLRAGKHRTGKHH